MNRWVEPVNIVVSIPLSRDSHCNGTQQKLPATPENVSIPLSRDSHCNTIVWSSDGQYRMFQSLYRGTAIATREASSDGTCGLCFNPSIEGQPLQRVDMYQSQVLWHFEFQSLYRGTAIATTNAEAEVKTF